MTTTLTALRQALATVRQLEQQIETALIAVEAGMSETEMAAADEYEGGSEWCERGPKLHRRANCPGHGKETAMASNHCGRCGAPYTYPEIWHGVTAPPATPGCACWNVTELVTSTGSDAATHAAEIERLRAAREADKLCFQVLRRKLRAEALEATALLKKTIKRTGDTVLEQAAETERLRAAQFTDMDLRRIIKRSDAKPRNGQDIRIAAKARKLLEGDSDGER